MKKSKTIGLKGLEDETLRICNAVGRWPGEFISETAIVSGNKSNNETRRLSIESSDSSESS